MVEGRTFWNATLPEVARPERRPIFDAMIDTLAALHNLDHEKLGLGDFGRSGNYFARQVERWTKQYRSAQTDDIPEVESLIDWLSRTLPEQGRTSIIHGDYRIDNLIYAVSGSDVLAVLDWELATIGDPLADFTYLAMNWVLAEDGRSGLMGVDLEGEGLPALGEAVARYTTATGRDSVPDLHWYFAYNLFRLVCILQGVKKRFADGNASSDQAESAAAKIGPLAKAAWAEARRAGTRN
jgi:aminoglycoside phosphotransferase (APT) family kinase protein